MVEMTKRGPPILIIGTGRCGSTIVYSLLAMHPELAWIPSWMNVLPGLPIVSAVNRLWDLPGTDRYRDASFFPKPVEPNRVFEHHVDNYYSEVLDADVVDSTRAWLVPLLDKLCRYQGRGRFLSKMVGRPVKVSLLSELFPGAFFIYLVRDVKPTLASFMQVDFYKRIERLEHWKWEPIPEVYWEYYESTDRAAEVGAAIQHLLTKAAVEKQILDQPSSSRMTLAYRDFVEDPVGSVRTVAERAGLSFGDDLARRLGMRNVRKGNDDKWRRYFSEAQVRNIDRLEQLNSS